MLRRIDIQCMDCFVIKEAVAKDDEKLKCPSCNSSKIRRVFLKDSVQIISQRASVIDHVIDYNRRKRTEQYEEDAGEIQEHSDNKAQFAGRYRPGAAGSQRSAREFSPF